MLSMFRISLLNAAKRVAQQPNILTSAFHSLSISNVTLVNSMQHKLLAPNLQSFVPCCGFKVMGRVRRRCRSCYFVRRQERLYVICEKNPRHKQMSMVKDPKNTWILSHATQSKVRPW